MGEEEEMMGSQIGCPGRKRKPTKRAKSIEMFDRVVQVKETVASYTCPNCLVKYVGARGTGMNVTRFICECGQELIIRKRIERR